MYKIGRKKRVYEIAKKCRDILEKYDIDPIMDSHNLISAPNKGHSIKNIQQVYDGLVLTEKQALAECEGLESAEIKEYLKQALYDELEILGKIAASR